MQEIFQKIFHIFQKRQFIPQLIVLQIIFFLLLLVIKTVCFLGGFSFDQLLFYVTLSTDWQKVIHYPWVLLSYGFVHVDFFSLLFYLFALYSLDTIISTILKQKVIQYILVFSFIFSACFLLVFCQFFSSLVNHYVVYSGGLGSVYLIFSLIFFLVPQYNFRLLGLKTVSIRFVFYAILLWLLLTFSLKNASHHIIILGNIVWGYFCSIFIKKKWTNLSTNFFFQKLNIKNRFCRKNGHSNDKILKKIEKYGYESLTPNEKYQLFKKK